MTNQQDLRCRIAEILELLRCDIINSVEDGTLGLTEEMVRQREFISKATDQILTLTEQTSCESKPQMMSEEEIREIIKEEIRLMTTDAYGVFTLLEDKIAHALAGKIAKPQAEPDGCECDEVYEQKVGDEWVCARCNKPFSNEKKLIHARGERYCGKPILGKEKIDIEQDTDAIIKPNSVTRVKITPKEHKDIEELEKDLEKPIGCFALDWTDWNILANKINELVKAMNERCK